MRLLPYTKQSSIPSEFTSRSLLSLEDATTRLRSRIERSECSTYGSRQGATVSSTCENTT